VDVPLRRPHDDGLSAIANEAAFCVYPLPPRNISAALGRSKASKSSDRRMIVSRSVEVDKARVLRLGELRLPANICDALFRHVAYCVSCRVGIEE
jgi:hypothetical protein